MFSRKRCNQIVRELRQTCEQFRKLKVNIDTLKTADQSLSKKSVNVLDRCTKVFDKFIGSVEKRYLDTSTDPPKKHGGFDKVVTLSTELAEFLQLKDPQLNRQELTLALNVYCHINPEKDDDKHRRWYYLNEEKRDLRNVTDRRIIEIDRDDRLAQLLRYKEYVAQVQSGQIFKELSIDKYANLAGSEQHEGDTVYLLKNGKKYIVQDIDDGKRKKKRLIETDTRVMLCTLQKLISVHIVPIQNEE